MMIGAGTAGFKAEVWYEVALRDGVGVLTAFRGFPLACGAFPRRQLPVLGVVPDPDRGGEVDGEPPVAGFYGSNAFLQPQLKPMGGQGRRRAGRLPDKTDFAAGPKRAILRS